MPRRRKLTDEQAREAVRRYHLGRANKLGKIAKDYGIGTRTLRAYVERDDEEFWRVYAEREKR